MFTVTALALRNLWRHRRRTLITMSTLVIGVAVVVFLSGFRNAFIQLILDDAIKSQAGAFQVHRAGYMDATYGTPLDLNVTADGTLEKALRAVPGVTGVTPRIRFGGLVSSGGKSSMFSGVAVHPVTEYEVCPLFRFRAVDADGNTSTPLGPEKDDGLLIGRELADGLHVKVGDSVTLLVQTLAGGMNALDATIIAYTLPTDPFSAKRGLWVTLPFAQRLLGMEGKATEMVVATASAGVIDETAAAARTALGPTYEVHTWEAIVPFVKDAIERLAYVLGIVSTVLLLIVITGVMNTVLMSVYERVREVGTMMALGMRRRSILALFVLEALGMCLMGALAGLGLGEAVVKYLDWRGIPISPPGGGMTALLHPWVTPGFMAGALAVAFLGTVVAAIYPAYKASRLRPVEALRAL
jgi:putative ABC transport system permease protein